MATFIAIGDPHFKVTNVPETTELVEKVIKLVKDKKPTFVVLLGDILDTHERVHITPFNNAVSFIKRLAKIVQTFVLIGNHDLLNNQQFMTTEHAFNGLKGINNIKIVDKPFIYNVSNNKFVFCPYTPPERFEEALNTLTEEWVDATCIFAHQEFYNCKLNPTMTSTNGDIWPEEYPLVISGHIHDKDWLQENIYYTGSSLQHGYSESSKKRILYASTNPMNFEEINLHLQRKLIVYKNFDNIEKYTPPENSLVKIVLAGNSEQFKIFRKSKKYKDLLRANCKISFDAETLNTEIPVTQKTNIIDILNDIVKKEKDEYLSKAFNILVHSSTRNE
jgi:DNA repair exonuclease SbcCD nuclease subunit